MATSAIQSMTGAFNGMIGETATEMERFSFAELQEVEEMKDCQTCYSNKKCRPGRQPACTERNSPDVECWCGLSKGKWPSINSPQRF